MKYQHNGGKYVQNMQRNSSKPVYVGTDRKKPGAKLKQSKVAKAARQLASKRRGDSEYYAKVGKLGGLSRGNKKINPASIVAQINT